MSDGIIMIGNIYYGKYRHGFAGNVVGVTGISPTITTRIGTASITHMVSLGHYPDQGVLVQGHYE